MRIEDSLIWATKELKKSCSRPRFEAELLLAYHLKRDRVYLYTHNIDIVEDIQKFKSLINRRAKFEPYEYIVNRVSFYDIELYIDRGVLIPRPETEILIDLVADIIKRENIISIAEIGVGSGAISIVLARKFPHLKVVATDISTKAIEIATINIEKFNLKDRVEIIKSNLLDEVDRDIELVVTNPPYIANSFKLEKNIIKYEPKEALFGGAVGDELLKEIVLDIKERDIKYLACEMGYDQKESMEEFFKQNKIKSFKFYQDLAGFDRGFIIDFRDKNANIQFSKR